MQETVEDGSFFCFQGADFEVHPAKIIQTEVAFCKTEVKFAIYRYLPLKMPICENGAKYNNNNWKNGAKVNKIQRDIVTQYKEVFSQYDSEDKKLKLISIKEEYRSTGLLNWDGWKGNVPSHIHVLSCQRTEHRAVDCGSGYGGSVRSREFIKRTEVLL